MLGKDFKLLSDIYLINRSMNIDRIKRRLYFGNMDSNAYITIFHTSPFDKTFILCN